MVRDLVRRHRWTAAASLYAVLSLAILARLWTISAAPKWDAHNYFYPAFVYLADAVREGRFPLWDPYTNCGLPFHADPQAATLNPIALLMALAVERRALAFIAFWVAHWIAAGLGMLVLARTLRATPWGAAFAALSYSFSGFFVGNAQHTSWIVTAAWFPWAVALAHRAVATGRWGFALLAGAAMALSALGGYPVLVGVGLYVLALWLVLAFVGPWARFEGARPSRLATIVRIGATLATVATILVLVWSPVLHAFLHEAREYTDRTRPVAGEVAALQHPFSYPSAFHPFSFRAAISLLFPYATVAARPWIPADISLNDAYLGLVALPLAAVAFTGRRPRRPWWLAALAALMVVASMCDGGWFQRLLEVLVPPMRYMRHNAGYRIFWLLPLSAAAGLGLSLVVASARARARMRRAHVATCLAAIAVGALVVAVVRSIGEPLTLEVLLRLFVPSLVVLPAAALFLRRRRAEARRGFLPAALIGLLVLDLAAHLHLTSITALGRRHLILDAERLPANPDPTVPRQAGIPYDSFNSHQITRTPVARGYVTMQSAGFNDVLARSRFLEVLMAHRYWLSPAAAVPRDAVHALERLAPLGKDDPIPVFVDRAEAALAGEPVVPGAFGTVRIASYAPERVRLEVDVPGPGPAVLVSTERFAPGWRVDLDGAPAPALRANLHFRGVLVPLGRHAVVWTYAPARWNALVALAAVTLAASVGGGLVLLRRHPAAPRNGSLG